MRSEARQPRAIAGALVLPEGREGITEQSTTRRWVTPLTRSLGSTTARGSEPILQLATVCVPAVDVLRKSARTSASLSQAAPGMISAPMYGLMAVWDMYLRIY